MRNSTRYASVEIVMQDNHVIVIMAKGIFFFFLGSSYLSGCIFAYLLNNYDGNSKESFENYPSKRLTCGNKLRQQDVCLRITLIW